MTRTQCCAIASGDVTTDLSRRLERLDVLPNLESTVCILPGTHGLHAHAWHNGFPRPPAHLAHAELLLRLPPLTFLAPEDNQSSAFALEPTRDRRPRSEGSKCLIRAALKNA